MATRNSSAQVMLEYLTIAAILFAAIIFGGPMLVNSIGAHFKIAEDNVGDAFSEKPKQASPEKCACNPASDNPTTWPAIADCGAPCGALEKNRERSCPGCTPDKEQACAESRDCCYDAVQGACGTLDSSMAGTLCVTRESGGGRCLDASGGVHGCLSDEMLYTKQCGENVTKFICVKDSNCKPDCTSETWEPAENTVCAGEEFTQTGNCKDTRTATGTLAAACPPATSVACGEEIVSTNGCGTCPGKGTQGTNCPAGYECKDGGCAKKCWSVIQTTDTGIVREGDGRGAGGCNSTIKNDDPHCGSFPGCPFGCNNDYKQIQNTSGDRCYTYRKLVGKKWHDRNQWVCADLDYKTLCYRDPCTSSNFSKTLDGWVNENGKCVK